MKDKESLELNKIEMGIRLSSEVKDIIKDVDLTQKIDDFPILNHCMKNNDIVNDLIAKLCDEQEFNKEYKPIEETHKKYLVKRLIKEIETKERKNNLRRLTMRYALSFVAAIAVLSFLVYKVNVKHNSTNLLYLTEANHFKEPTLIVDNIYNVSLLNTKTKLDSKVNINDIAQSGKSLNVGAYNVNKDKSIVKATKENTVVIPAGYTYKLVLADNTEVMMNAQSELKFMSNFNDSCRIVTLKGEAFFRVTKDSRPFIVKTELGDIKVYGTEFNVNLNRKNKLQVVLLSGSVGVKTKNANIDEMILEPNYMLDYNAKLGYVNKLKVEANEYVSWMNMSISFDNIVLEDLLDELSAWYGVEFETEKTGIPNVSLSISVGRDINILDLLNLIESMVNVKFERKGGNVFSIYVDK